MTKRKPYVRPVGRTWWLKHAFYTKYMIREGTSVLQAIYGFILLFGLLRLAQGEAAFNGWLEAMQHPFAIVVHLLVLGMTLYHTATWFDLAPKAANLWVGEKKVEDQLIVKGLWGAFAAVSLIVLLILV